MSSHDETDVAAILEQLRSELRALRAAQHEDQAGTALGAIERELHHCAEQLEIARVVSAHWPLEGRNLYERMWALINKIVRRALRWYINPIVEQQNAFNDAAARALRLLIEAHAELRDQLAELQRNKTIPPPLTDVPASTQLPSHTPTSELQQLIEQHGANEPPTAATQLPSHTPTSELQQLIEQHGANEPPAALPDLALRPWPARVAERAVVKAHWPLEGERPLDQARALTKRALRQYLRWLINPIVEQQNGANAVISAAMAPLIAADGELRARLAALRARR
jgi:hypothetical protein